MKKQRKPGKKVFLKERDSESYKAIASGIVVEDGEPSNYLLMIDFSSDGSNKHIEFNYREHDSFVDQSGMIELTEEEIRTKLETLLVSLDELLELL